ncbi:uncharacterized protein LOC34621973 [Cyclospora cayetanensis]|uniref:Uncharacterized protein LOC34621973 n=1 Tax=Cyclospora cayetanensis TaxID=88456 RepID=A0A6P6RUF3_9EIME|nr:uncharacterized protein LOC34621973 [Cyclospora cayetanensis]
MSSDSDSDYEIAPFHHLGTPAHGSGSSASAAHVAGGSHRTARQSYLTLRALRARRRAQRRQFVVIAVLVLAAVSALYGRAPSGGSGVGGSAVQDATADVLHALRGGQLKEALLAFFEALRAFGNSSTAKKLILPIFLAVMLRVARKKVTESINGRRDENRAEPAAAKAHEENPEGGSTSGERPSAPAYEWFRRMQHTFSAAVCALLSAVGDPAAGLCRAQCRRWAHSSAASAASGGRDAGEAGGKEGLACAFGFIGCTLVCALAFVLLMVFLAWLAQPSASQSVPTAGTGEATTERFANPFLATVLESSGLSNPWPSFVGSAEFHAADGPAAADMSFPGSRLLRGELHSWYLLVLLALGIGCVAAFAEMLPINGLDDNLTFPIITLVCLSGVLGVYVHLSGLAGKQVTGQALSSMDSLMLASHPGSWHPSHFSLLDTGKQKKAVWEHR